MIKRLLAVSLFLLLFISIKAQNFGNEWIDYSLKYYKIPVTQNGIYNISYATLQAAGVPVNTINPHNFQIFNKGAQQNIYVQGESSGIFNPTDFIEFYGEKNDGSLDSRLYVNNFFVPNPYYSLINDTAMYFLTWNNSINNNRFIVESDTSFSGYTPDNYFLKDEVESFHSAFYQGETDAVGGTDSRYTSSEGFFDAHVITLGANYNYSNIVNTSNAYAAGPNARIEIVVVGASKDAGLISLDSSDHHLNIQYSGASGVNTLVDTLFKGYEANRFIYSKPVSLLGPTYTDFNFSSIADPQFNSNRTIVSYIRVKYPHTYNLEGNSSFMMYIDNSAIRSKKYLNISNFSATDSVRIYDITSGKRINVLQSGNNYKALLPNSIIGNEKKCFITSDANIINVTSLKPVTTNAKFTNYATALVNSDSAFIIVTNKALMSSALNYKAYRSSVPGGSHHVLLTDIDELYDQFAYGIVKSPLSIRGLCDMLIHANPTKIPQNLFLIGKSIHMRDCRNNSFWYYYQDLVPSYGNPSSDNLFTCGLNGGSALEIAIPTGRLSAKNLANVDLYLRKIQDYESSTPDDWKKEVLHFGGGKTSFEQFSFKSYLDSYKTIIEDTAFGGHVTSFFKTSTSPIQINQSDSLRDMINKGVSLMTFFGHASGTGFDQSIDDIQSYSPIAGHYPFVLANSCYAGDIHQLDRTPSGYPLSSSETFVLTADKGAIAYAGSVALGVPYVLNYFSNQFYKELSNLNYGKSIGRNIKNTVNFMQNYAATDSIAKNVCMEMTLHGDPSISINSYQKPDYKISCNNVFFDLVSKQPDSVIVFVVRTNIGKAVHENIIDELMRILPNGDTIYYYKQSAAPFYKDTISFTIPVDFVNGIGLNKIVVSLDRYNESNELNESNNTSCEVNMLLNGGAIVPVYPYQFAIIPNNDSLTLKASTANAFAATKKYRFQIDTTDRFNSPMFRETVINSAGGVVTWKLPNGYMLHSATDSTVYFWRVSPDSTAATPGNGYFWRESSFQHISGKIGWEQAHFFQYKDDTYQYVKFNRPQRRFDFVNDIRNIFCRDGITPYIPWTDIIYSINGVTKNLSSYAIPGFSIAVIDPISGNPRINLANGNGTGQYNSITSHPAGTPENCFELKDNSPTWRNYLATFFNNVDNSLLSPIKTGDYVLAYSQKSLSNAIYDFVTPNALGWVFEHVLGSTQLATMPASRPYILFTKIGSNVSKEVVGSATSSIITFDTAITSNFTSGSIYSPVIGPALSWGSFHWRQRTLDGATTQDSIVVKIIGIKVNGTEDSLACFHIDSLDVYDLARYVDVAQYPKIRLVASMQDPNLHTPPQMKRWQVIYAPVPEATINPAIGFSYAQGDTSVMQQGNKVKIYLPIQNIGDMPFVDSLLVTYWIEDANRGIHSLPSKVKKPGFMPGEVIMDTINLNSSSYMGNCGLWVEVNPVNPLNPIDLSNTQLEQYHFNNIARIGFTVNPDRINPLLDVTFDGVHILNNDIVSAKPNILIKLKDENQYLALNDTSDFKIFIQSPSQPLKRIYFGNSITFIPAVLPNNSCKINYMPSLIEDGTYQLIIEAKDRSNNLSGINDYKISFEVINKSTITEVMNYPNPFSTSTHFVFTITGSVIPTYFKIQILTITGKVVREINNDELGVIHIGRNITDYAWNGKDEFGDQLANGLYLYRVVTSINGEIIEKTQTDADQYFKKGFGKMYLMR